MSKMMAFLGSILVLSTLISASTFSLPPRNDNKLHDHKTAANVLYTDLIFPFAKMLYHAGDERPSVELLERHASGKAKEFVGYVAHTFLSIEDMGANYYKTSNRDAPNSFAKCIASLPNQQLRTAEQWYKDAIHCIRPCEREILIDARNDLSQGTEAAQEYGFRIGQYWDDIHNDNVL
jgi:hypothetical protein